MTSCKLLSSFTTLGGGIRATMKRIYLIGTALLACALTAAAGTICPAGNGANPFPHTPDSAATGCNVVITISGTSTLTATTAVTDPTPYDNVEDFLVGVINNSTPPITSLGPSGSGIFGFAHFNFHDYQRQQRDRQFQFGHNQWLDLFQPGGQSLRRVTGNTQCRNSGAGIHGPGGSRSDGARHGPATAQELTANNTTIP